MGLKDELQQEVAGQAQDRMTLSVGPHHPATHGVLRLVLELEGETIVKATPEHGFLHTGIEKTAEHLTWQQAITVLDRMDYLSPLSNNLGYSLAVEKLLGIEVPPKAVWTRVLLAELQRISSHLVYFGTGGVDVGAMTPIFLAFDIREMILDIFEEVAGSRLHQSYFRIGGLQQDLPANFNEIMRNFIKKFPERLEELKSLILENPIFIDRTKGIGKLSPEEAIAHGLTGPNLRASGVPYDVRKAFPYCDYDKFDFEVPVGQNGDCYDRMVVRMREIEESFKIVQQAFEGMPEGPFRCEDRKISLPPKAEVKQSMEALIHHFKLVSYGFDVPPGEVYQAVESARGEFAVYVVSMGTNKPWRVRVRPPSFYAVHALPAMLKNCQIADMVVVIAAADPVFGEVDR
ncbi:MAG: NADH dehydrogenase (quinone) subunit D [Firmicutes bacterium]|nr:NADH dehydrogenase (quinone) subunit D [Bacillota bacterium]